MNVLDSLSKSIQHATELSISGERKAVLNALIDYIQSGVKSGKEVNLNFICTHNSRRSQFSQIWAQVAAYYYGVEINSFSGGVEVTEFNPRAVASVTRFGFKVEKDGDVNPRYAVRYSEDAQPLLCFSKTFDDPSNPKENFAAVMTCSHADENCPFIAGAEARIPVRYDDPKMFDDTDAESSKYDERSLQIAAEMFYVFSRVSAP
ncbi:MAG: protein-tyrosine-phosphatase [Bacteroidota bacterium]